MHTHIGVFLFVDKWRAEETCNTRGITRCEGLDRIGRWWTSYNSRWTSILPNPRPQHHHREKHNIMATQRYHKHRYHRRKYKIAISLLSSFVYFHPSPSSKCECCRKGGIFGVDALPRDRNNKQDPVTTNSFNSMHHTRNGRGRSTRSVALHDSFPCESAADQQDRHPEPEQGIASLGSTSKPVGDNSPLTSSTIGGAGNNNSNDTCGAINPLKTRGGGAEQACMIEIANEVPSILLSDEMLDKIVEDLINAEHSRDVLVGEDEADNEKSNRDAPIDGKVSDIDHCAELSIIEGTLAESHATSGTIPAVAQWIRALILSIVQSIFDLVRKLQKLCRMQQKNCDADRNMITNDGGICTTQQFYPICRNSFAHQASVNMQSRFTFHVSMNNGASTSTKRGREHNNNRRATTVNNLSTHTLSKGINPLPSMIQSSTSRPQMDLTQLQSRLLQRKSSSILISAEKPNIKAPPMQLLNKVRRRIDTSNDAE